MTAAEGTTKRNGSGSSGGGVAADATFLETLDQTASVLDLHRSNLLRLQAEELVNECRLGHHQGGAGAGAGAGAGGGGSTTRVAKLPGWTSQVAPFAEQLSTLLQSVSLSKIDQSTLDSCPFHVHNKKETLRLLEGFQKVNKKAQSVHVLPFTSPISASPSSSSGLSLLALGRSSCGLTKASGNANVAPTFDLILQMPNSIWENKDYKNHRYFDKRNLLVWHVAQTLSHKKNRSKVGRVFWTLDASDVRKPTLMVLPPATSTSSSSKKRKKDRDSNTDNKTSNKNPKFRIQIRFEMESLNWIPSPLRLVPNRSNLPSTNTATSSGENTVGSPMYNHAILEDAYHSFLPATKHHSHQANKTHDAEEDSDTSNDDEEEEEHYPHYTDAVVLAKIWCLQRGLLRNHDGFHTNHLALLILYLYRTKRANPRMAPLQVLAVLFKCLAETLWLESSNTEADNSTTTGAANNNNLLRTSPSEASYYQKQQHHQPSSSNSSRRRKPRAVLVLPSLGRTEAQTIAHSSLAKLYSQQTKESPLTDNDPPTLVELYRRSYPGPVFLDSTLKFNYFGRLSPSFIKLAQYEARRSLHFLNSPLSSNSNDDELAAPTEKPFAALFMTPIRFFDRFDMYIKIPIDQFRKQATTTTTSKGMWSTAHQTDWGQWEALTRSLMEVLQQALGDRVTSMRILSTGNGSTRSAGGGENNSDQIPLYEIQKGRSTTLKAAKETLQLTSSPTGDDCIVLGVSLNVDTCPRVVDRGPPAEQVEAVNTFVDFWGDKAELRRFKDGAIVQAVVWNTTKNEPGMNTMDSSYIRYQNEDVLQGGIVERIIRYIIHRHFLIATNTNTNTNQHRMILSSPLRNMTSIIDGVASEANTGAATGPSWFSNPTLAHRHVMKAFDDLAAFLREHSLPSLPVPGTLEEKTSRLGIPLAIDAVEPLSPSLRYSELFPPLPHPLLGGAGIRGLRKTAGVILSDPVLIQIRFGASSKWPTDIKAIGAAKTAMLVQLANGIEDMMQSTSRNECSGFSGLIAVTPGYLDVGYQGYVFRIQVRADPEIRLLRGLFNPSTDAAALLRELTRDHIVLAMHHSMIHAIHTKHASAGGVVRMAMRWVSGHMLSGLIPLEAIELLVAKVYSDRSSPLEAPASVVAGFLRLLQLLESHDWIREPLIVDPHGHIDDEDRSAINARFEQVRGPNHEGGPPLYIISPNDRQGIEDSLGSTQDTTTWVPKGGKSSAIWTPSFTSKVPEWVVLTRSIALARKTRTFLLSKLTSFEQPEEGSSWSAAFQETSTSYQAYSALLRIDPDLLVDTLSASTGKDVSRAITASSDEKDGRETSYATSMRQRYLGPKKLRLKVYRNMRNHDEMDHQVCHDWRPVDALVGTLRAKFGSLAIFFYNQLCPDVIAILWRPHVLSSHPFSVMGSEHIRPCVDANWKADTMVKVHVGDVFREMGQYWEGIAVKTKLLQSPVASAQNEQGSEGSEGRNKEKKRQRKSKEQSSESESEEE